MANDKIVIKGAREHNLKNIDLTLPREKFIVMTGLSGSGKSSLAFDTIYADGQRRYVESLSSYARMFLGRMDKPDVDEITGLSPAISIDQKTTSRNPRSTVGTVTEIYDYLRLLFARAGEPHCPKCGKLIEQQSVQQIVDKVLELPQGSRFMVMAPLVRGRKGEHMRVLDDMRRAGYVRMFIDGEVRTLDEDIRLEKNKKHSLSVVIDRLAVRDGIRQRLTDSVETALKLADGFAEVATLGEATETQLFSEHFACNDCGISLPAIEPRLFSFNNPFGACPDCTGLGMHMEFDKALIVPDADKSFAGRCIACFSNNLNSYFMKQLGAVLAAYGYSYDTKWNELSPEMQQLLWDGAGESKFKFLYENLQGEVKEHNTTFDGILNVLRRRYREAFSDAMRQDLEEFMTSTPCAACHGSRLKPEALSILIGGKNICEVTALTVRDCLQFFKKLELTPKQQIIAHQVLKEIMARLQFLNDVGLDYLTLDRSAGTLSGGEAQRIRLATQIGSGLVGVLYILDEPSIGLHQRDNDKLLNTLKNLRDLGNTLVVVEHDEDTMLAADYIVDIGPGAGSHGGEVIACGTAEEIMKIPESITGQYLSGKKRIPVPETRRTPTGWIKVLGAQENNLKNVDVEIPLGVMTCVTGVSGSGKSSLVNEILYKHLARELNRARCIPGRHKGIEGVEQLDKVINIDQSPIGRTPRSNPATYTGVFDLIRDLFASTADAKAKGYSKGRFSFNVKGGRCEACGGDGIIKIEMHFLPDVYVPCEVCGGKRYNRETLDVKYKGKSIFDVLDMTVEEALPFFENVPFIRRKIETLYDVGLSYVKLGQPSTTLSGGEAQRIKLATELSRRSTGRTIYILDEPTTGLHFEDVHKLVEILHRLADGGNTVVVIEHNLDVIKTADYIIDMGPEGGDRGGTVIAKGTPEEIVKVKKSYTGYYVKKMLEKDKKLR